jgi:hypothetical protein
MSSDHRQRPIDKGSVSRSRDRWRPPDEKRIRRPAGDRTADLEKTTGNGNNPANSAPHLSLQARRSAELRRQRRIRRVQTIADMCAPRLWFEIFDQMARGLDAEDYVDALLEKFARVDPAVLRALGADKLPRPPLRQVR